MDNGKINEPWNLTVLQHAIERFRQRSCGDTMSTEKIANKLRNIVCHGKEMVFKNQTDEMRQILKHDCKKARYYMDKNLLVVVEDKNIITCHGAEAGKWKPKE